MRSKWSKLEVEDLKVNEEINLKVSKDIIRIDGLEVSGVESRELKGNKRNWSK